MANHTLTEKNLETLTAVCAIDGPVKLRSRGAGRYCCSVKKSERHQQWAQRNPDRARQNRRTRSLHRITGLDENTMTGDCPVCGLVGVVIKGRRRKDGSPGVMCANRAKELFGSARHDEVQERCSTCQRAYLNADSSCLYCSDRSQSEVGYGLKEMEALQKEAQRVQDWTEGELTYIYDLGEHSPYSLEGDTVANPALKVIGAGVPDGMSTKKFIEQWMRDNAHRL